MMNKYMQDIHELMLNLVTCRLSNLMCSNYTPKIQFYNGNKYVKFAMCSIIFNMSKLTSMVTYSNIYTTYVLTKHKIKESVK